VAGGERTRSTSTDYWPGGERSLRRTQRESVDDDTVERWFRFSDGRLSRTDRKREGAAGFLKEQPYDYDLNGNRIQDERGGHEFNSRDQLVLWNPDTAGKPDVAYELNGSGGIVERTQGGELTAYHYLAGDERLDYAITTVGGQSARTNYSYDTGFGDVTKYQVVGEPDPAAEFVYDAFGRQTRATRGAKVEDFSYDGLDRRDTREVGTKFFDLSYVGLSEALSQESQFAGGDERRSYDYTSALERVGTARKPDGESGEAPYRAYSLDANGSVEGLQDDTGDDSDQRYGYDPYGEALDSTGDPQDEADLSPDQQANPFRFEGHYYDAAFKTYDMKARAYLPEIGRFLQEDHYEQALGDQALETDPLTQDRYAFAGGNPLNNIEFDGHEPIGSFNPRGEQTMQDSNGRQLRGRSDAGRRAAQQCNCNTSSQPPPRLPSTSDSYTTQATFPGAAKPPHPADAGREGLLHAPTVRNGRSIDYPDYGAQAFRGQLPPAHFSDPDAFVSWATVLWPGGGEAKAGVVGGSWAIRAFRGLAKGSDEAAKVGTSGRTTVVGENMMDWVIPYAERTGGRTVDRVSPGEWARMTPRQRWKANDSALRSRIREGDVFSYIGRDPDRPDWVRRRFDLTGSELLRLRDRGIPFEIVRRSRVRQVIGRR
jgi:RHS repeat-associated protein